MLTRGGRAATNNVRKTQRRQSSAEMHRQIGDVEWKGQSRRVVLQTQQRFPQFAVPGREKLLDHREEMSAIVANVTQGPIETSKAKDTANDIGQFNVQFLNNASLFFFVVFERSAVPARSSEEVEHSTEYMRRSVPSRGSREANVVCT